MTKRDKISCGSFFFVGDSENKKDCTMNFQELIVAVCLVLCSMVGSISGVGKEIPV